MSAPLPDRRREVIPRWRDIGRTVALGEHGPSFQGRGRPRPQPPREFLDKLADWNAERSLPFATEVVGSAIVFGAEADATAPAQYVIDHAPEAMPQAVELAQRILSGEPRTALLQRIDTAAVRNSIRQRKEELRIYPRDAFGWAELARNYALLGQADKAVWAMDRAVSLGPNNRYILRSAARLQAHIGEAERAHRILMRSDATPFDPWLAASEIALARLAGASPTLIKEGRRMLSSSSISDFDKSELASAVATAEADSGNLREARRFFRMSLSNPNDNAVAQARWAEKQGILHLPEALLRVATAYEARAWYWFYQGDWDRAWKAARNWLKDQPFSASPAVHGSYVASVAMESYRNAIEMAKQALVANPHDPNLLNNVAYSLANLGDLDGAAQYLNRAEQFSSTQMKPVLLATRGLVEFRRGNPARGAALYEMAIGEADSLLNAQLAAKASLFFAIEEIRAARTTAMNVAERAIAAASVWKNSDFDMIRERLANMIIEYRSKRGA